MLRCGPEWLFRQIVVPTTARGRKREKGRVGAKGMSPPQALVHTDHGKLEARPRGDVRSVEHIDQLVIHNESGAESYIELYPGMNAKSLRQKVKALGLKEIPKVHLTCDEDKLTLYKTLLQEVWPGTKWEALATTPAGKHQVTAEYLFRVNDHYFRAIAKIAFHYYLVQSQRARGDEDTFAPIRQFILEGGDMSRFVSQQTSFYIDELCRGYTPSRWHHLLAADETTGNVVSCVCLFVGPGFKGIQYQVAIGRLRCRLVLPSALWAHSFDYSEIDKQRRTVGSVNVVGISRRPVP